MNCKPGDLAYVVSDPQSPNYGLVVTVLRPAGQAEVIAALRAIGINATPEPGPIAAWFVEPPLSAKCFITGKSVELPYALDKHLRPIRPGGITDEEVRELYSPKLPEVA